MGPTGSPGKKPVDLTRELIDEFLAWSAKKGHHGNGNSVGHIANQHIAMDFWIEHLAGRDLRRLNLQNDILPPLKNQPQQANRRRTLRSFYSCRPAQAVRAPPPCPRNPGHPSASLAGVRRGSARTAAPVVRSPVRSATSSTAASRRSGFRSALGLWRHRSIVDPFPSSEEGGVTPTHLGLSASKLPDECLQLHMGTAGQSSCTSILVLIYLGREFESEATPLGGKCQK